MGAGRRKQRGSIGRRDRIDVANGRGRQGRKIAEVLATELTS